MEKNYNDITREWLQKATPNSHKVEEQKYYEKDGIKYQVDGKKVVLDYSIEEREVAEWLRNTFGGEIKMLPRINIPEGIQTADFLFRNMKFDLKKINGRGKRAIDSLIKCKKKQSNNFVIDISNTLLSLSEIKSQINIMYKNAGREWINIIILKKKQNLILVSQKKRFPPAPTRQDKSLYK